ASAHHPHVPSFPTRRSSDLGGCRWTASPPQNTRPLEYSVAYAWFTYQIDVLTISSSIVGSPISTLIFGTIASGDRSGSPLLMSRSEEHTSELQSHLNLVCRL